MIKLSLEKTVYHSILRIALVVFAFLLVFDSGIISSKTSEMSMSTQNYLANAIGINASVTPTEVNQLTARITQLEGEVSEKDRQINVNLNTSESGMDKSTLVLSIILFILLVLILLNYLLDYLRMRQVNNLQTR